MLKKLLFKHKTDQGMVVRGTGLAMIAALLLFGCDGLYYWALNQGDFFHQPIGGLVIPLIDLDINGALVLALVVFVSGVLVVSHFMGRPKTADLLIETETELQKVTWPSWTETVNASIVVIFTTLLMAVMLFVFDFILRKATGLLL
jgi:preprotein translocase SecE subunit